MTYSTYLNYWNIKRGRLNTPIEVDDSPFLVKDTWFWLGTGLNFVLYDQKVDNFSNLKSQSLTGPTIHASGGTYLNESFGFEGSFKDTTGSIKDSATTVNYNWTTFTLEALYRRQQSLNNEGFIKGSQWVWRAGLQHHNIPFLNVPNFSVLSVELKENTVLSAHAGASYFFSPSPRWRYEVTGRYQLPFSSTGEENFELSPIIAFDGSIGLTYKLSDNFYLGTHWYNQWYKFKYNYGSNTNTQSGEQDLIFSNFDIRIGLEY